MDLLKKNQDGTFNVVNETAIIVGATFLLPPKKDDNKRMKAQVTEVIEQRKERGVYKDESKRRMWGIVRAELLTETT